MPHNEIALFRNIGLSDADTGGQTSTVGEPSAANNGRQILLTGNWYATRSLDNGNTWAHMSPYNFFPPVDGGFCCDQTVLYDRSRDLLFWILQYITANNTNTLRIAVKQGPTLGNNDWHWWDLTPVNVNANWKGEWFDYNHAALSNHFLYVGSNVFQVADDQWTRSVIFKLSLDELAADRGLSLRYFESTENFSLRCVQGAGDVMYIGSHNTNAQLRLFSWPEDSDAITVTDVDVSFWRGGTYSAPGPDGNDWLSRCDPRITGAWVANGMIGFMWAANSLDPSRPMPYVRAVRIDESAKTLVDEPDIWNRNYAYAYPAASPNDRGHVGISLFRGGGTRNPGHVVGIWDDQSNKRWDLRGTRDGTDGPSDGTWGDYVACRRHSPDGLTWLATGYTLEGGSTREDIVPRVVQFGREHDKGAVVRWQDS